MSLLAHAIFAEGLKNLAAGASGVDLKRGLDRGLTAAVTALRGQSRPVSSTREKAQVATISAHNDPALGDFVATAMDRVGGVLECVAVKAPGYAARGVFCDVVEAGIIDPTKVVRVALENAVSVAGTLLLTEATLTEVKDEKDELHRPALAAEL